MLDFSTSPTLHIVVISHLKMDEEKVKLWNNLRLSRIWCCKMNVKDNTMVSQLQFKQCIYMHNANLVSESVNSFSQSSWWSTSLKYSMINLGYNLQHVRGKGRTVGQKVTVLKLYKNLDQTVTHRELKFWNSYHNSSTKKCMEFG